MTEEEMLKDLDKRDYGVDEGNVIGGPFIPDGRVRIYHRLTNHVESEGATLEEAYSEMAGLAYLIGTER